MRDRKKDADRIIMDIYRVYDRWNDIDIHGY